MNRKIVHGTKPISLVSYHSGKVVFCQDKKNCLVSNELYENIVQLKMLSSDGKRYQELNPLPQCMSVFFQPFTRPSVIGQYAFHYGIEGFRMVHLPAVGKFMNDYIVQHFLRGEDEPPVEVEVALAAAASPARLLLPDGNAAVGDAHDARIVFCLAGDDISGDANVSGAVLFRHCRTPGISMCVGLLLNFSQMLLDPLLLFTDKRVDIRAGTAPGRADNDPALRCDLQGKGLSAAVNDLIIKCEFHSASPMIACCPLYTDAIPKL